MNMGNWYSQPPLHQVRKMKTKNHLPGNSQFPPLTAGMYAHFISSRTITSYIRCITDSGVIQTNWELHSGFMAGMFPVFQGPMAVYAFMMKKCRNNLMV